MVAQKLTLHVLPVGLLLVWPNVMHNTEQMNAQSQLTSQLRHWTLLPAGRKSLSAPSPHEATSIVHSSMETEILTPSGSKVVHISQFLKGVSIMKFAHVAAPADEVQE